MESTEACVLKMMHRAADPLQAIWVIHFIPVQPVRLVTEYAGDKRTKGVGDK